MPTESQALLGIFTQHVLWVRQDVLWASILAVVDHTEQHRLEPRNAKLLCYQAVSLALSHFFELLVGHLAFMPQYVALSAAAPIIIYQCPLEQWS
jgi:hypothetical protein